MRKSVRLQSFELIARDIVEVDVGQLHALSLSVGWPHRPKDWDLLLKVGKGLAAVDGIGRVFGSAMWFPHGDDFATLGMVITTPRTQAQGNGRWLMEQVFDRCGSRNLSLNSTRAAYKLYLSLDFVKEATVSQWQGEVADMLPVRPAAEGELIELDPADLDAIAALDAVAFGTDRSDLLRLICRQATLYGIQRNGALVGYSCCREFGRGHVIGPVVAMNDHDAVCLTAVHLESLKGRFARVDTREKGGVFASFLMESGLRLFGTVTTMSRGRPFLDRRQDRPWVYGLAAHAWS